MCQIIYVCILVQHVTFCIYCPGYSRHSAALNNETVFWGNGLLWHVILMFSINKEDRRGKRAIVSAVSSVFWKKTLDLQVDDSESCGKGEIPPLTTPHA